MRWLTAEGRRNWREPIDFLQKIASNFDAQTVESGVRDCALDFVYASNFESRADELRGQGLHFVPLKSAPATQGFTHSSGQSRPDKDELIKGALARELETGQKLKHAWRQGKKKMIGELLGYPDCCIEFFQHVEGKGFFDPVWHSARNTPSARLRKDSGKLLVEVGPDVNHLLFAALRYVELSIIPHFVCGLNCSESVGVIEDFFNLLKDLHPRAAETLKTIHQWPIRWGCLKGVAYVTTPVFQIEVPSMPVYPKLEVRKRGKYRPDSGVEGVPFSAEG